MGRMTFTAVTLVWQKPTFQLQHLLKRGLAPWRNFETASDTLVPSICKQVKGLTLFGQVFVNSRS
jgi:hypothetical protein